MATQRVKVRVSIPVSILVFETEGGEVITEHPDEYLDVEGVVQVDSTLKGVDRDAAAKQVALESLAGILAENMDLPGMLGGCGRSRRDR